MGHKAEREGGLWAGLGRSEYGMGQGWGLMRLCLYSSSPLTPTRPTGGLHSTRIRAALPALKEGAPPPCSTPEPSVRPPPAPAGLPSSLWVARTPTSQGLPALSPGSWCLCFLAPRGRESPEEGAVLLMCSPTMLTCWPHLHVLFRAQGGLRRAPPAHPLGCCSSPLGPAVLAAWRSGGILTTEPAHLHLPAGARPSPDPGQDPTLSARTTQPAQGAPLLQGRRPSTQRSGLPRGRGLAAAPQPSLPLPAEAGTRDERAPDPCTCRTGRSGAWTRLQQGGRDG